MTSCGSVSAGFSSEKLRSMIKDKNCNVSTDPDEYTDIYRKNQIWLTKKRCRVMWEDTITGLSHRFKRQRSHWWEEAKSLKEKTLNYQMKIWSDSVWSYDCCLNGKLRLWLTESSFRKETRGVSFRVSLHFRSHSASNSLMELLTSGIPSLEIFCLVVKQDLHSLAH